MQTLKNLFNFSSNGEEVAPYGNLSTERNPFKESDWELDFGRVVHKEDLKHHTKDNFLIHCINPLKIAVLLLVFIERSE